jgi:hypothetical protein
VLAIRRINDLIVDEIAVEVQFSDPDLDESEALARTKRLGDGSGRRRVLWLTRHCSWVQQLPAAGILYEPGPTKYDSTEIAELHYRVDVGRLRAGRRGQVTQDRPALEAFLRDFAEQRLLWMPYDTGHHGWAELAVWRSHLNAARPSALSRFNRLGRCDAPWMSYVDSSAPKANETRPTRNDLPTCSTLRAQKTAATETTYPRRPLAGRISKYNFEPLSTPRTLWRTDRRRSDGTRR